MAALPQQVTENDDVPLHAPSAVALPPGYAAAKWPVVARQLSAGGLRLARLLNHLLGESGSAALPSTPRRTSRLAR